MIKRLNDLRLDNNKLYRKIIARQRRNRMSVHYDSQGYVCYESDELKFWKPKKSGRPHKTFICEICGQETPIEFEGSEPNCCESCKPLDSVKDSQELHRRAITLKAEKSGTQAKFERKE